MKLNYRYQYYAINRHKSIYLIYYLHGVIRIVYMNIKLNARRCLANSSFLLPESIAIDDRPQKV